MEIEKPKRFDLSTLAEFVDVERERVEQRRLEALHAFLLIINRKLAKGQFKCEPNGDITVTWFSWLSPVRKLDDNYGMNLAYHNPEFQEAGYNQVRFHRGDFRNRFQFSLIERNSLPPLPVAKLTLR